MKKPLLVIELDNEESVPKVFYDGEEITNKVRVFFNWETDVPGKLEFNIEHIHDVDAKKPSLKGVGLKRNGSNITRRNRHVHYM